MYQVLKKFICISILFIFSSLCNAQLDLEHWFPPFLESAKRPLTTQEIHLTLSTEKEIPFKVNLYNNNTVIEQFIISKDNPIDYIVSDKYLRITNPKNTMNNLSLGIHLAGEYSFYASIKLIGSETSELISSKGKSALGNNFFVVNDKSILYDADEPDGKLKFMMNYQASIMAIEDATNILVENYDKRLVFANGQKSKDLKITLNKGESYVIAAIKSDNVDSERPHPVLDDSDPNLIGAKIYSDKKIVLLNGNNLSQDNGDVGYNINLDQSVPIEKLGKEYLITNGLTYPNGLMEKVIIVAIKDDTKIYFNNDRDETVTLNKGEYYIGPGTNIKKFINGFQPAFTNSKSAIIETKSLYIRSNQPIYLYQLSGGFQDKPFRLEVEQTTSTSTMMFTYPLDIDYLSDPRQQLSNMVVLPSIDKISNRNLDTKLTIKSKKGATIYVNGDKLDPNDFSSIEGNSEWSYWSRFQQKGDLTIRSDNSLIIDYFGGFRFSGLSGSYTGFSNDPFIIKNGNCIQETVTLYLNNVDFKKFQWRLDGKDIVGANLSSYQPTKAGKYTCIVSYMDFTFETNEVIVEDCPYNLSEYSIDNLCDRIDIDVKFSNPNQNLTIEKLEILTQPLNGKAEIENGLIKLIPNLSFNGNDRFVYKITSPDNYNEIFKVNYNKLKSPIGEVKAELKSNTIMDGINYFDLNQVIISFNNENFTFFESEVDALQNNNKITEIHHYASQTEKLIYIRISNSFGCFIIKPFKLVLDKNIISHKNLITPNGDGFNDTWDLTDKNKYLENDILIFDRYGKIVVQGKVKNILPWNGKQNNKILSSDTYWYIVKDHKNEILKGYILLKAK